MKRPELTTKITIGDVEHIIKWTYGMSLDIQRLIPDFDNAFNVTINDPNTRDYLLRRLLTEKRGSVEKDEELVDVEVLDEADPDDILRVLDWATGHLLYFFGSSVDNFRLRAKEYNDLLAPAIPSMNGSEDSASPTPSAGPGEPSKET
jgi:hypothetical protein